MYLELTSPVSGDVLGASYLSTSVESALDYPFPPGTETLIEDGLSEGEVQAELAPLVVQQAFIDQDAFQCGYCTPGQILSAIGCVKEGHAGSDTEIREYMSGNLCRCGAYKGIVDAVSLEKT